MRVRNYVFALLGLLFALSLIWAVSAYVIDDTSSPAVLRESRFEQADRMLFYRLEPNEQLQLAIPPDADSIKVFSHVILPKELEASPEREFTYGIGMRIWGGEGKQVLDRELFTRTRESVAEQGQGSFKQQSAFLSDDTAHLTDGRDFLVKLPEELTARATSAAVLYLRYTGERGTLLLRVSAHFRHPAPFIARHRAEALERAERVVERSTFVPWEKLPAQSQEALASERWSRLGVMGKLDEDYRVEAVYRTDWKLPLQDLLEDAQSSLPPWRGVAVNAVGPVKLDLRVWRDGGKPAHAQIRTVAMDGQSTLSELELSGGEIGVQPLDIPEGPHTVEIVNDGLGELRYAVYGPASAQLGPVRSLESSDAVPYAPDVRQSEAYLTGPGCHAMELEIPEGAVAGRILRVDARGISQRDDALTDSQIHVALLDGRGRELGSLKLPVTKDISSFESAELASVPGRTLPCEVNTGAPTDNLASELITGSASVSLPATGKLFLPPGTQTLRVTSSATVAVQLSTFLAAPNGSKTSPPYVDDPEGRTEWRSAPLEARNWFTLRPANHDALVEQGARAILSSQVRIEPIAPTAKPEREAVALLPAGRPMSLELLEQTDDLDVTKEKQPSLWTALSDKPLKIRFDKRTRSRPEVRLVVTDAAQLGKELQLLVDGKVAQTTKLTGTRMRWLLRPLAEGEHELALQASVPSLHALLNRPASGKGAIAVKARTAFRLAQGGLRVAVRKTDAGPLTVNVMVYSRTPVSEKLPPSLKVAVDSGNPERRAGVLLQKISRASAIYPLPASERPPGLAFGSRPGEWYARSIPVTLGDDIAPGLHWVSVDVDQKVELFARFWMYGHGPDDGTQREWHRAGWDREDD
ncbi:MAG: hypothetical protein ACJ790_01355 [Myxococcaceae bacterium]